MCAHTGPSHNYTYIVDDHPVSNETWSLASHTRPHLKPQPQQLVAIILHDELAQAVVLKVRCAVAKHARGLGVAGLQVRDMVSSISMFRP